MCVREMSGNFVFSLLYEPCLMRGHSIMYYGVKRKVVPKLPLLNPLSWTTGSSSFCLCSLYGNIQCFHNSFTSRGIMLIKMYFCHKVVTYHFTHIVLGGGGDSGKPNTDDIDDDDDGVPGWYIYLPFKLQKAGDKRQNYVFSSPKMFCTSFITLRIQRQEGRL